MHLKGKPYLMKVLGGANFVHDPNYQPKAIIASHCISNPNDIMFLGIFGLWFFKVSCSLVTHYSHKWVFRCSPFGRRTTFELKRWKPPYSSGVSPSNMKNFKAMIHKINVKAKARAKQFWLSNGPLVFETWEHTSHLRK